MTNAALLDAADHGPPPPRPCGRWLSLASGCSKSCAGRILAMTLMAGRLRIKPRNLDYSFASPSRDHAASVASALNTETSRKCAYVTPPLSSASAQGGDEMSVTRFVIE